MLDEDFRARIRDAAEHTEVSPRDVDARARRAAHAMAAEMARTRRNRAIGAGAFVLAAAAAVALVARTADRAVPSDDRASVAPPACASRAPVDDPIRALDHRVREDFGARFRIATSDDARVHVDASARCASTLSLVTGHVDVWARSLEGGALDVRVGDVRVSVRGTRFRVAQEDGAIEVHVAEGTVAVYRAEARVAVLRANQSLRLADDVLTIPMPTDVRADLAALLAEDVGTTAQALPATLPNEAAAAANDAPQGAPTSPTPGEVTPAPSSDALVLEAERAQREGRLDEARTLFTRAGRGSTATAEAAWIRLARLELRAGRPRDARAAIANHDRRFRSGRLAAEALYVDSVASRALGDARAAEQAERTLLERFPESPQAARVRAR